MIVMFKNHALVTDQNFPPTGIIKPFFLSVNYLWAYITLRIVF